MTNIPICPLMSRPVKVDRSTPYERRSDWVLHKAKCLQENCAWWDADRNACSIHSLSWLGYE